MAKCNECGKKLKMLSGFKHPIKGKKYPVCSPCFDNVQEVVRFNREEVLNEVAHTYLLSDNVKSINSELGKLFSPPKLKVTLEN
jgi:hypothetical protein